MSLDLASLISAARQTAEATAQAKALKAEAKTARTPVKAQALQAAAAEIQSRVDWRTTYFVFRIIEWDCRCGCKGERPDGLFLFQEHARMANSYRLVRPATGQDLPQFSDQPIPRRVQRTTEPALMCASCCGGSGFERMFVEPTRRVPQTPALLGQGEFVQEFRALTEQEEDE